MAVKKWELISSKDVFTNPFVELYQDTLKTSNGRLIENFYSLKRKSYVAVVAINSDGEVLLVQQYRNGIRDVIWNLPAGFIEKSETPETSAARELAEETGFRAEKFTSLGSWAVNPGFTSEHLDVYLAEGARKAGDQNLDENEEIEFKLFDFKELVSDIKTSSPLIVDIQTALSLLLAERYLTK